MTKHPHAPSASAPVPSRRFIPGPVMLGAGVGTKAAPPIPGVSYHHRENDRGRGGLEEPEQGQAEQLDGGEKVHPAQGHVAQVDEVRLVLGRHQEQPHTVRELQRQDGTGSHPSGSWAALTHPPAQTRAGRVGFHHRFCT